MIEQNENTVQEVSSKKWSVTASFYLILAVSLFLYDYLVIQITKYRHVVSLGLIVFSGFIAYPLFITYVVFGLFSILYWIINRKVNRIRAAIPMLIVFVTLIIYIFYVVFVAQYINGGGSWYNFIIYEIDKLLG